MRRSRFSIRRVLASRRCPDRNAMAKEKFAFSSRMARHYATVYQVFVRYSPLQLVFATLRQPYMTAKSEIEFRWHRELQLYRSWQRSSIAKRMVIRNIPKPSKNLIDSRGRGDMLRSSVPNSGLKGNPVRGECCRKSGTAPATVSGERPRRSHWAIAWEGGVSR